jgi:drug/metabolite transporter (DMT)-like permease
MTARLKHLAMRLRLVIARSPRMTTLVLTGLAMCAFAANSLLCRLALSEPVIDPASFTTIRLISGALILWLLVKRREARVTRRRPDWPAAVMLFVYAAAFSFAYVSLNAGTGALILFGSVQLTMLAVGLWMGERLSPTAWAGLFLAIGGFLVLVAPGVGAPAPLGALLMALAGIAWGVYSLRGRGAVDPVQQTAANFLRAAPLGVLLSLAFAADAKLSVAGWVLAVMSGALASGGGYVIWYAALRGLSATGAATVQLSVPVITALGGALFLAETFTLRLLAASVAVLGGIALVLRSR